MSLEISSSPSQLNSGNKRLTKVPLIIIGIMILLILFSVVYAAIVRKQNQSRQEPVVAEESKKQAQGNAKDINNYIDALSQDVKPTAPVVPIETPQNEIKETNHAPHTPPPLGTQKKGEAMQDQTDQKELQMKKDMRLKALIAASNIKTQARQNENAQTQSAKPTAQNLNDALTASIAAAASKTNEKMSEQEATEFLKRTANKGYLQQKKEKPISPYELKAGWIIPAVLITGINSDLPGSILAQISQNVYDTATGKYLLIPQGTKAVGEYKSNIVYGQERVLTAWTKLIFPNGDTLNLEGMNGTSQDGYSGFTDQVNNHYFRIFGSAFLMSSITAGIALSDKSSSSSSDKETNADKAMSQAIEQMSTVASEMIRKNMNIAPTLEIRPGYKFNIFVTKDIILEPLSLEKGE